MNLCKDSAPTRRDRGSNPDMSGFSKQYWAEWVGTNKVCLSVPEAKSEYSACRSIDISEPGV